jgi:hypothetical protein
MSWLSKITSKAADPERDFVEAITAAVRAGRAAGVSEAAMSRVFASWVTNIQNRRRLEIERRNAP